MYNIPPEKAVACLNIPVQNIGNVLISISLYIDDIELKLLISLLSKVVFSPCDRTVLSGAHKNILLYAMGLTVFKAREYIIVSVLILLHET